MSLCTDHHSASVPSATPNVAGCKRHYAHLPKGWPAPRFEEPIHGANVAGLCTFPGYDEVAKRHSGLVMTVGEYDTETCEGLLYFGNWFMELRQLELDAKGGTDTAESLVRP